MLIKPLTGFIIKTVLLLPICYWGWYYCGDFITWITADLSRSLLTSHFPDLIETVQQQGKKLDIITRLTIQNSAHARAADIVYSVNPLNYNFGLPLCLALILASPGSFLYKARNIMLLLPVFLAVELWGVYFAGLKILFFDLSAYSNKIVSLSQTQRDMIAVAYQLGTLILPAVTPLLVWLFFYRKFIVSITPALQRIDNP